MCTADPCYGDANPCLNGGTCSSTEDGYNCSCTDKWMGPQCNDREYLQHICYLSYKHTNLSLRTNATFAELMRYIVVLCHTVAAFNYTGCADDFLAIIADGVEVGHTRRINVSVSVTIPSGTRVLGIRLVRCSIPRVIGEKHILQFSCQEDCLKQVHLIIANVSFSSVQFIV